MKIILLGYGKMGREVEQIALQRGHEIIARIDNSSGIQEFRNSGIQGIRNSGIHGDSENIVAIEFSTPTTALENIHRCFDMNIPVVCGTTGWYEHLDEIKERCEKEQQTFFYAPNFSIGMNITFMLNKQLAKLSEKYDYKISLTETHHIHKLDKPSGTAVKLAEDIIENNENYNSWKLNQFTIDNEQCTMNNEEWRMKNEEWRMKNEEWRMKNEEWRMKNEEWRMKNGEWRMENVLQVEAIREGDVFGIHEVKAESDCDVIQLRHEAFSRKGFATGAVIAAEFLLGKKGVFTMNDLFKI